MKKILLPLTAVAAFAVIAAANIKIAAALAIMIVFFSGIFATLPRLMEFQDRLEIRRWKKRLEENEKRKEEKRYAITYLLDTEFEDYFNNRKVNVKFNVDNNHNVISYYSFK